MAKGTLKWADPDYATLKCICGNETEFNEIALRETSQSFVVKRNAPIGEVFDDWDTSHDTVYPTSIECAKCEREVWSAKKKEKP